MLIRELGEQLCEGVRQLLTAAQQEHYDVKVLKFLLTTASFAKKFCDNKHFKAIDY